MKKFLVSIILILPIIAFAQLANYKASFSFGGGATQYFGDLSHRFVNLKLTSYSVNAAFQYKPTKGIGMELEYKYLNLIGDDKADYFILNKGKANPNFNRSLNFKSSIHEANLKFYFYLNNGKIISKYAVVSPYFFVGIGGGIFNSKSNLLDANGNQYNYWSDGTIRDLAETDPLSINAQIIEKDKSYETNLRGLETETTYSNFKWQVPFGLGLNFKLSKNIYLSLQTEWVYNFTDYIDDVGNKPLKTTYPTPFSAYAANPANTITSTRGNDNKWKDSYLNTTMKFNFYFGNKDRKLAKNISSNITVPIKDFSIKTPINTVIPKIDTIVPVKKDTVIIIYKTIEYINNYYNTIEDTTTNTIKNNIVRIDSVMKYDTIFKLKVNDSVKTIKAIKPNLKLDSLTIKKTDSLTTKKLNNSTRIKTDSLIVYKDSLSIDSIKKIKTSAGLTKLEDSLILKNNTLINVNKIENIPLTNSEIAENTVYTDSVEIIDVDSIITNIKNNSDTIPKYEENILLRPKQNNTLIRDSIKINKVDTITKIIIDDAKIKTQKADSIVKLKMVDSVKVKTLQSNKIDTVTATITNSKIENPAAIPINTIQNVVRDTIVVLKTNNSKDSIVLNNHVMLKNIYTNISSNNLLYDSINQKLSKILDKNKNTKITQKIAVKNDTVYKYINADKLSNEQIKEVNNFKIENDNLKISLAKQKKYNDSITIAYKKTQENLADKKTNEKLNPNIILPTPATNYLPNNVHEILLQELIKNKTASQPTNNNSATSQNNQEIAQLKREMELLKQQLHNKNNTTTAKQTQPVFIKDNNDNSEELKALKAEIEALKENSLSKDTIVSAPINTIDNTEIIDLKKEIDSLKSRNSIKDTVVVIKNVNVNNNEIDNLKGDLDSFKNEIQQLKENANKKPVVEPKPVVAPKDSLLLQVFFATNKLELDDAYIADLEKIYFTLLFRTDAKLLLTGFADRDGDKTYNLKLSAERAQSVKNYFVVTKKINYDRILMNYVGSNQTKSTDNKDYNRRVDVYLMK